jgi:hypothetical protein
VTTPAVNNTIQDLKTYFGTPERPVTTSEFKDFYMSLTDTEKAYFKSTPLT